MNRIHDNPKNVSEHDAYRIINFSRSLDPHIVVEAIQKTLHNKLSDIMSRYTGERIGIVSYIEIRQELGKFCTTVNNSIFKFLRIGSGEMITYFMNVAIYADLFRSNADCLISCVEDMPILDSDLQINQFIEFAGYINDLDSVINTVSGDDSIIIERLYSVMRNYMNGENIIYFLCIRLHDLILSCKSVYDQKKDKNQSNRSKSSSRAKNGTPYICNEAKIKKIVKILISFADIRIFTPIYIKLLQIRLINRKMGTLYIEKLIFNMISPSLDSYQNEKISSIMHSGVMMKNMETNSGAVVSPIIIDNTIWELPEYIGIDPVYPDELKECFELVERDPYTKKYTADMIRWQYTMGEVDLNMTFGKNNVTIKCNPLQAIALFYIAPKKKISISEFAVYSKINKQLVVKIIDSITESNIMIYDEINDEFIINEHNYTGSTYVDINAHFREKVHK